MKIKITAAVYMIFQLTRRKKKKLQIPNYDINSICK